MNIVQSKYTWKSSSSSTLENDWKWRVYGRKKRAWLKKIDSGVVFIVAVCFKFGDGAKQATCVLHSAFLATPETLQIQYLIFFILKIDKWDNRVRVWSCMYILREVISWHTFSYTLHTQERETKRKRKDREEKYYKIVTVYILCKKKCLKITFLKYKIQ
jgi:hypothetical protein